MLCGLHGTAGYSVWFRGPLGSDGKTDRYKYKLRGSNEMLWSLQCTTERKTIDKTMTPSSEHYEHV